MNAYEQKVRTDLTEILESRGLASDVVLDLVDVLSALVRDAKRQSFIDGLKRGKHESGRPTGPRQYSRTVTTPPVVDRARMTSDGHQLRYSSAVQAGIIKRVVHAQAQV